MCLFWVIVYIYRFIQVFAYTTKQLKMANVEDGGGNDWQAVSLKLLKEPHNFDLWQQFIYAAEYPDGRAVDITSSDLKKSQLRQSYESFLRKYPLLSKYWTAYANWEQKLDNISLADEIFSRGLRYVRLDLHYWLVYLRFKIETISDNVAQVAELFEDAREAVGYHYYSFELYSLYISFLKTYSTVENQYDNRLGLLLRLTMEIPMYDYAGLFREIMAYIQPKNQSFKHLDSFLGQAVLKTIKKDCNNNSNLILKRVTKLVSDAYVVSQFKSYEMYTFEKNIASPISYTPTKLSAQERGTWHQYLVYVEHNFPSEYVIQLYQRCTYLTSSYCEFYEMFVDFLVFSQKYNLARKYLQQGVSVVSNHGNTTLLLRLIDLEIYCGKICRARDLIVSYILANKNVPVRIFDKLLEVETYINGDSEEHLCHLTKEVIKATKSTTYFRKIRDFSVSQKKLGEFYLLYATPEQIKDLSLETCEAFWKGLLETAGESQLETVPVPAQFKGKVGSV